MKRGIAIVAVVLVACSQDEPPPEPKAEPQGRAETQSIRNTDAVGYSGGAIAGKVDTALDQNEDAARRRQEAADQADSP